MFGRLTRLGIDLVAISVILAGVKKATGHSPATNKIKDSSIRGFFQSYLGMGETVFSFICGFAVSSDYFRRTIE